MRYVESHKGYFVNGYKFHTLKHGDGRVTHNSGVCVKGSTYNEFESDYYGLLVEVLELNYHDSNGRCVVVLFKCDWFEPIQGVRVNRKHNLVDMKYKSKGCQNDPFILTSQVEQVYYAPYPSMTKDLKDCSFKRTKCLLRTISVNDQDVDYDDGRSEGRGRGRSKNIGGRGSSNVSRFVLRNPTLPVILSVFSKLCFMVLGRRGERLTKKAKTTCLRNFRIYNQSTPSENAAVYKAWERVMSSRYSDILGQCRRDAAHRATMDNITVGNDLSVLKPYTPSWIDQAHWDNMIDRLWNTSRWKKKSNVARQNRLTEVDGEVSKHTAGSKTILQHKFQMDAVEAAIEKHGPDASEHPPNDFDLWGEATGGGRKLSAEMCRISYFHSLVLNICSDDTSVEFTHSFSVFQERNSGAVKKVIQLVSVPVILSSFIFSRKHDDLDNY
ncbi:transposase, Ptta/En/Spm [Tanacetum coccineum]